MNEMAVVAVSTSVMAWVTPVALIVLFTLLGYVVERITTRWARSLALRLTKRHESVIAGALRGHITFWGFLLGVGLALQYVYFRGMLNYVTIPGVSSATMLYQFISDGLVALFIASLTIMLARIISGLIVTSATANARPVVSLVTTVTTLLVFVVGFLAVLAIYGVTITPYITALGVGGLAVGLALQATLTDLVSGMLLISSHQVQPGQYVKLPTGEEGYIADITWRTTTIRQLNNNVIIVPNAKMTSSSVTNYHMPERDQPVVVTVTVAYDSDLDLVERVSVAVAQEVMRTVPGGAPDFQPVVRFTALGDYSVTFSVVMQGKQMSDQALITHEFIKRIRRRYREEGIRIPVPIQQVRLREEPAAPSSAALDGALDGALPNDLGAEHGQADADAPSSALSSR